MEQEKQAKVRQASDAREVEMGDEFPVSFPMDSGGNSALTRLEAEVACNQGKDGNELVTDSSLMHDDLRQILRRLTARAAQPEAKGEALGPNGECPHCGKTDCRCDKEHFL